jgi:hypothetical protein
MRIAVMVISLILGLFVFLQSCVASVASDVSNTEDSTAAGVLVPFLWLLGGAFVLRHPKVSTVMFAIAAAFALLVATSSIYEDMYVWSVVSAVLAVMSFFGHRQKLDEDREKMAEKDRQMQRDRMLEEMMMRDRRGQ